MRSVVLLLSLLATLAPAQEAMTALDALKLLPKDVLKKLARIEAREGAPWPQRWYFLVYDAAEPRGLREFVVANGKIEASRTLSQFADELKPADVIGAAAVNLNSDEAVGIAAQFAMANSSRLGTVNYELSKINTTPIWRLTCLNQQGDEIGVVSLHATKRTVLGHDGFEIVPEGRAPTARPSEITPVVATPPHAAAPKAAPSAKPAAKPGARPVEKPEAPATPQPAPKSGPLDMGRSLRRLFGGAR